MKMIRNKGLNIFRIILALLISLLMCLCMCACGGSSNVEETVEITTPSEETEAPADNSGDENAGGDAKSGNAGDSKQEGSGEYSSQYEKIYSECNAQMRKDTLQYVGELEEKAESLSRSDLYDETQSRIDQLKKVYDDGKDKMVKAMLASTEDDAKEYDKYFQKMTEKYTEYSRELTTTYTEAF